MRKSKELQAVLAVEQDLNDHENLIVKCSRHVGKDELDGLHAENRAKTMALKDALDILSKANLDEYIAWMKGEYESN